MVSLTVFIMSKTHTEKDRERERESAGRDKGGNAA